MRVCSPHFTLIVYRYRLRRWFGTFSRHFRWSFSCCHHQIFFGRYRIHAVEFDVDDFLSDFQISAVDSWNLIVFRFGLILIFHTCWNHRSEIVEHHANVFSPLFRVSTPEIRNRFPVSGTLPQISRRSRDFFAHFGIRGITCPRTSGEIRGTRPSFSGLKWRKSPLLRAENRRKKHCITRVHKFNKIPTVIYFFFSRCNWCVSTLLYTMRMCISVHLFQAQSDTRTYVIQLYFLSWILICWFFSDLSFIFHGFVICFHAFCVFLVENRAFSNVYFHVFSSTILIQFKSSWFSAELFCSWAAWILNSSVAIYICIDSTRFHRWIAIVCNHDHMFPSILISQF